MGLEIFKENSIEDKIKSIKRDFFLNIIKVFIKICDRDNDGAITESEFYNVLKRNAIS